MRRKRDEEQLHRQVASYLDLALPPEALWWHTPSGGARSKAEAGIFKAMGTKPGVHDIFILWRKRLYGIELKVKGGRITPPQIGFHERFVVAGGISTVCWSFDEVIGFLDMIGIPLKARAA